MESDRFTLVKLTFRSKCKLAKLEKATDTSFSSLKNLQTLIFKHFPEIEGILERPPKKITGGADLRTHLLTIKCKDTVGHFITLGSEQDLDAMELSQRSHVDFSIKVTPIPSDRSHKAPVLHGKKTRDRKLQSSGSSCWSDKASDLHTKRTQCPKLQSRGSRHSQASRSAFDPGPSNSNAGTIDSEAVEVQEPPRGSVSKDRRSNTPSLGQRLRQSSLRAGLEQEWDYNKWLNVRAVAHSETNIAYLTGENGYSMLSKLINQRNLPHKTIGLFVQLLAREEIRTSLLRQQTNKIYGALVGTPFLLQLNDHVASHLQMLPILRPQDVRPYIELTEEVLLRTMKGWQEVPLNALKGVVSKLEDSTAKDELMAIVTRLTDQCERLQRLLSLKPANQEQFLGEDFRTISILPGKDELVEFQGKQQLPVIGIGVQYCRVSDYLETHFRLLREDCIAPFRQGIKRYRSRHNITTGSAQHSESNATMDLRVYGGVKLTEIRCGGEGLEFVVSFRLPASERIGEDWKSSKNLMFGALLCISSDHFQTFFIGVVSHRQPRELANGRVGIRIIGESDASKFVELQERRTSRETYVMVESTASYFEAYHHVLKTLQLQEMENIPFTPYLVRLEPSVSPPSYLQRRKGGDEYDFSCAFPEIVEKLGKTCIRVLQSEWPSGWTDSLDKAQQDALKQGLTKELAIIQGPPGTGKTFLGLILVKILLANLKQSPSHNLKEFNLARGYDFGKDVNELCQTCAEPDQQAGDLSGPILIICYTNHALDQFLEGIYGNGEKNLIRIGGRGKSEVLKERTLQALLTEQMKLGNVHRNPNHRLTARERSNKSVLRSKIKKCTNALNVQFVTADMLEGIATQEQRQSLFWIDEGCNRSSTQTVKLWLTETDPYLAQHFLAMHEENSESENNRAVARRSPAEEPSKSLIRLLQSSDSHEHMELGKRPLSWVEDAVRPGADVPVRLLDQIELRKDTADGNGRRVDIPDEGQLGSCNNQNHGADLTVQQSKLPVSGEDPDVGNTRRLDQNQVAHFADEGTIEDIVRLAPDVWQLTLPQRTMLHEYWLHEKRKVHRQELKALTKEYEEACKAVNEIENEKKLSMLRKANVVGMTTTAGARLHDVLKSLKPEIVIVEEAAEVLEAHILACIRPSVKHLILIGDHIQLRPSVAAYELAVRNKLDVSMFERLVRSGVEHVTLQEQRRMRPSISKLVRSLYPGSRDHSSVGQYENVQGVKSNVFFFDHKTEEDYNCHAAGSKVNSEEAVLVVELCMYLLNQGCYKPENIAILAMYAGQSEVIQRLLLARISISTIGAPPFQDPAAEEDKLPRVSSVDGYQGEESDIIILSLVRSNSIVTKAGVGQIGFLSISNRICVALTRARKGLFIFGNADLLAEKSTLWNDVTTSMRNRGELGSQLELYCPNHPDTITRIATAEDFKQVEDGGCTLPCDFQFACGHACPRRCHPGSHDLILCPKPCLRHRDTCRHSCNSPRHGSKDCPPCRVIVTKSMPCCKHEQAVACSTDPTEEVCRSACGKNLQCGHQCRKLCRRPCTKLCLEKIMKTLPCGHSTTMKCHQDPVTFSCDQPCPAILSDCQHQCQGSCGRCQRGEHHIPCQQKCGRTLPCGHLCEAGCSLSCPPCVKRCQKKCFHSRCSEPCGNLCTPCQEPCSWQCAHHKCEKRCHEICTRPRCDLPCPKLIRKCGHPCIGLCGEQCPKKCRLCHPQTLDIITRLTLGEYEESDRFVQLEDCGHIFEVGGLDTWMDSYETSLVDGSVAIKLKQCPECRASVWRTNRYSNVVKKKHSQVEAVKEKVLGQELLKKGHILLRQSDSKGALHAFQRALEQNADLVMDVHLGLSMAFFARKAHDKAITHLSLIVERSSFAVSLAKHVESAQRLDNASGLLDKHYRKSSRRAGDSIAIKAVLQWASALTHETQFTGAIELCDAILGRDPENELAKEIREKAQKRQKKQKEKGDVQLVVQAMAGELGARGHWYTCPNGHFYTIGECGGAMELSKCPDCNAVVGGEQHRLTAGNKHSNIDGSERSAWPGN